MNNQDKIVMELSRMQPHHAEGHICIDLTDPITGKIKERIQGKNTAFPVNIYGSSNSSTNYIYSGSWVNDLASLTTVLTDNVNALDTSLALLPGQVVGYGLPGQAGSGTYRGSYNAANQIIASQSLSSVRWKYQYDFTSAQANGTIGTIGLSDQYRPTRRFDVKPLLVSRSSSYNTVTCDGRYGYTCSTAGVITKFDCILDTSSTIDVSATVGTLAASQKWVAYDASTGRYGVYVYNSTTSLIRLYLFTDASFSTVYATYSPSAILYNGGGPLYIYGNYLFLVNSANILYANFVANTAYSTLVPTYSKYAQNEGLNGYNTISMLQYGTMAYSKYLFFGFGPYSYYQYPAGVIDMSTLSQVAYSVRQYLSQTREVAYSLVKNPFYTDMCVPAMTTQFGYLTNFGVSAMKKLDNPVVKTSANGMTVTYELEVFW